MAGRAAVYHGQEVQRYAVVIFALLKRQMQCSGLEENRHPISVKPSKGLMRISHQSLALNRNFLEKRENGLFCIFPLDKEQSGGADQGNP